MDLKKLALDMGNLKENAVLEAVRNEVRTNSGNLYEIIEALSQGMNIVGEKFDEFEYFVGDLIFAGEVFTEALEIIQPGFPESIIGDNGKKVILATVEGDVHDLGKNIVKTVLQSKGFEVIDLGVNVSPATIVQRTLEENAHIVALSAVLTIAVDSMERTVAAFTSAGIRDKVSIIVGGACMNETVAKKIKADAFGKTPEDTAAFCFAVD